MNPARESPVAVLSKAGALLDCLTDGELTPAELTDRMGEPRSSIYRLIASLNGLELIQPGVRRGTYRLGLKVLRLGGVVMASFGEREVARPVMQRIHKATGETVFLWVRRGSGAVCIDLIDGKHIQLSAVRLGSALPLHAGAAPRTLLAFEPEAHWQLYLEAEGSLEAMTSIDAGTLKGLLHEVRREGVSISDQDVIVGIAAVGAPIFGFDGQIRAALSTSGIREAILGEDSQAVQLTIEGAAEISRQLGHRPNTEVS